jgi:uncharacterized protein with FMN-binding domain
MKKYILSAFVIISFLYYSFSVRQNLNISQVPNPNTIPNIPDTSTNIPSPTTLNITTNKKYKNGTFTGDTVDAYYGNIQVAAVIENGNLSRVTILNYPNDRSRSIAINTQALPILQSEAIQAQTASVDIVSGATDSSQAFIESLGSALQKALN